MITNGVFTDRLLPYVSEIRLDEIQITLDGTKDVHNARRIDPDGFGTYETIIRNLTKLFNKLNVIIRVNISEDNIDDAFTLCDELLSIIPMNTETRVFFQPALIEDYNQSGKFCRSAPVPASHFIDKYVSLLEYSGMLSIPRFIYSHCNISIPGSLLIRADGSLCKCWAQATDNNSGVLTINSDVNHIMRYVVVSGTAKTSKRCKQCDIFPSCLGGCSAASHNLESCLAKRQLCIASILKGYIARQATDNLHYAMLRNELQWLESIGCQVSYRQNGIKVSRPSISDNADMYYDFNFFIGLEKTERCLRLSQRAPVNGAGFDSVAGYKREDVYDINYFMFARHEGSASFSEDIAISLVPLNDWAGATASRVRRRNAAYYHIVLNEVVIGFFSLLYTDIIGVYDFEILPAYRSKGYGQKALSALSTVTDAQLFIQTWSTNHSARKCYEAAGFKAFEVLNRYVKTT